MENITSMSMRHHVICVQKLHEILQFFVYNLQSDFAQYELAFEPVKFHHKRLLCSRKKIENHISKQNKLQKLPNKRNFEQ